jgi:hypothetical protein
MDKNTREFAGCPQCAELEFLKSLRVLGTEEE